MKLEHNDTIIIQGLVFYGYHGVMPEEAKVGCRFSVDVTCGLDLSAAARTDNVDDTVSYELIYNTIRDSFSERRFNLLEALAGHIMDRIFAACPQLHWIEIRVGKLEAPIPAANGVFSVSLKRQRP